MIAPILVKRSTGGTLTSLQHGPDAFPGDSIWLSKMNQALSKSDMKWTWYGLLVNDFESYYSVGR